MVTLMRNLSYFADLCLLVAVLTSCHRQSSVAELGTLPLWQPVEMSVKGEVKADNPFLVPLDAMVVAPDGSRLKVPAFYDGDGVWKVRVLPHMPGRWSATMVSNQPELSGWQFAFTCGGPVAGAPVHGRLRVDTENPHHFKWEDGRRFFMMAYECDWLWALDCGDGEVPRIRKFLDKIGGHGFNTVIVNAFALDTKWRSGNTAPDDYGPPPLLPWPGTAEKPQHTKLNLAYWQHFDRMMHALHERGMVTHLLCKVYNKKVKWPGRGSPGDELFFRTLIARYSAYPGVVWDFAKEAHNEKDKDYKLARVRYLREADPFRHLVTVHDDDAMYDTGAYDALADFRTDQQHQSFGAIVRSQHRRRNFPVMNSEFSYEHGAGGPKDVTYAIGHGPEEMVKRAWEISFAGGYTAYYHTHTAWDVLRPEIDPPGYPLFGFMRQFFEGTRYWELNPRDPGGDGVWAMDSPGKEHVFWIPKDYVGKVPLPAEVKGMLATWFQPLTGKTWPVEEGWSDNREIQPATEVLQGPLVLHLQRTEDRK